MTVHQELALERSYTHYEVPVRLGDRKRCKLLVIQMTVMIQVSMVILILRDVVTRYGYGSISYE